MSNETNKKNKPVQQQKATNGIWWIWIISALVLLFALFVLIVRFPTTVTEVRSVEVAYTTTEQVDTVYTEKQNVQEDYTTEQCNFVNIKARTMDLLFNSVCVDTTSNCINNEQYCCGYTQECASYEQYCCATNWFGGCTKYCSRCASNKDVCSKHCTRCAGYTYPCIKYKNTCTLKIKNLDDETGGYFTFKNTFYDSNNNAIKSESKDTYANAGDIGYLSFDYFTTGKEVNSCNGDITSYPTKNVCKNVIAYRTVPKDVVKIVKVPKEVVKMHMVDKEFQVIKGYTLMDKWTGNVKYYYRK